MIELDRANGVVSEAAVLVGVKLTDQVSDIAPLEELEGLALTAGARIVGTFYAAPAGSGCGDLHGQRQGGGSGWADQTI